MSRHALTTAVRHPTHVQLSKVHLTPDKMILVHRTEGVDSDVQVRARWRRFAWSKCLLFHSRLPLSSLRPGQRSFSRMSFLRTESSPLTKTTRLSSTCTLSNLQRLTSPHRANPPLGALWLVDSQLDSLEILTNAVREQALKSTVTASEVTLKLTKRGGVACLAIIIGMTTVTGMARPVTQAVTSFPPPQPFLPIGLYWSG